MGMSIWKKQWKMLLASFSLAALNMTFIAPWNWHFSQPIDDSTSGTSAPKMTFLWANVSTSNRSFETFLKYVQAQDVDVILLAEVDQAWVEALNPLNEDWTYKIFSPREDNFGMAVYSKIPFENDRILSFEAFEVPAIQFQLNHPSGHDVSIFAVHPVPPIGRRYTQSRDAYLDGLSRHLSGTTRPRFIIGDFNATPWHAPVRQLIQQGRLDYIPPDPGWFPNTWPSSLLPVGIPIDLCLADVSKLKIQIQRGPDIGSDHRPLVGRMYFVE